MYILRACVEEPLLGSIFCFYKHRLFRENRGNLCWRPSTLPLPMADKRPSAIAVQSGAGSASNSDHLQTPGKTPGKPQPPAEKPALPETYAIPDVWRFDDIQGGPMGALNRPTAGARFQEELPLGVHPYQLYSLGTPNGQKVTILLEELHDLENVEYDGWRIEMMQQKQFSSGFVEVKNPLPRAFAVHLPPC